MTSLSRLSMYVAIAVAAVGLALVTVAVTGARGEGWNQASIVDPIYRPVVPVASDEGIGRLVGNEFFQSEDACLDYLKDPRFMEMLKDIVVSLHVRGLRLTGSPRCDKFDPPGSVPS